VVKQFGQQQLCRIRQVTQTQFVFGQLTARNPKQHGQLLLGKPYYVSDAVFVFGLFHSAKQLTV
jgi:hypothetical protein